MEKNNFNYEKSICAIFIRYLDKFDFLDEGEKSLILQIGLTYRNTLSKLYELYDFIINHSDKLEFEIDKLKLNVKGKRYILSFNEREIQCKEKDIKNILEGIIDILEEILPIGTVIEVKESILENLLVNNERKDNPKFIIIGRFLVQSEMKAYFPYQAVPYPMGEIKDKNSIYLTNTAIDKIIYKGFSDEQDEAFICIMKNEMLIKKNMYSISFADKSERDNYLERIS